MKKEEKKEKKKRILMLNYEYPPLGGGAGNATYYLLKEFSKYKDIEIDLVTSSTSNFRVEKVSDNVKIHFLDILKDGDFHYQKNSDLLNYSYKAYFYSKKLMKRREFDLCHAFFGIPCGFIAMQLKIPYIVSLRGSDVPGYSQRYGLFDKCVFKRLSKRIWRKASDVVANSDGLRDLALETCDYHDIKVIPNGIDVDDFKPSKKKKKSDYIRIVSAGRLISRKGFDVLIKAMHGKKNFELNLVGDGPLREKLESLAKENCVRVNFLGRVRHERVESIFQESDIFILPSLNEGMSNAMLEAMACGLPIVTTDTGGSKELVKDNGFLVKKASVESLSEVLDRFENDRDLIEVMGKKSREMAEEMGWKNVAKKYFSLY